MKKNIKISIFLLLCCFMLLSCKKKVRHKWIEVGAPTQSEVVRFGVQDREGDKDAVPIYSALIYYPIGRNKLGEPQYKKYIYELEELSQEGIDQGLKYLGVIFPDSVLVDFTIENSNQNISAGPGGLEGETLNQIGTVRYKNLGSPRDNSDDYEDEKNKEGMVDIKDIIYCITETYKENFQLVDCYFEPVE